LKPESFCLAQEERQFINARNFFLLMGLFLMCGYVGMLLLDTTCLTALWRYSFGTKKCLNMMRVAFVCLKLSWKMS